MGCTAFGATDLGLVRQNNEDAICVREEKIGRLPNLFIVADGMGGHNAGEIASKKAIQYFCEYIENHREDAGYTEDIIAEAVKFANKQVLTLARSDESLTGMGTTFTVCSVDNVNLYFAHVGDSRAYIFSQGAMLQITDDHTLVNEMKKSGSITEEEALCHPKRNVITRAVGTDAGIFPDKGYVPLADEATVLICSDGLTNFVRDNVICSVVNSAGELSGKAATLIDLAKKGGGGDNISVVLVRKTL